MKDIITQETTEETIIEFAKRFAAGEQDIYIDGKHIIEEPLQYFWQEREVYNHIAPFIDYYLGNDSAWRYYKEAVGDSFNQVYQESKNKDDKKIYGPNGLVMRLVPYQREYNAIRRRNMELINQVVFGNMLVEDGSVDVDSLDNEGMTPGKVLVYRQGSTPPTFKKSPEADYIRVIDDLADSVLKQMHVIYSYWKEGLKE